MSVKCYSCGRHCCCRGRGWPSCCAVSGRGGGSVATTAAIICSCSCCCYGCFTLLQALPLDLSLGLSLCSLSCSFLLQLLLLGSSTKGSSVLAWHDAMVVSNMCCKSSVMYYYVCPHVQCPSRFTFAMCDQSLMMQSLESPLLR